MLGFDEYQRVLHKLYNEDLLCQCMETVTISKKEYESLKRQNQMDTDFLHQMISSLKDIKEGRVRKVH